MALTEKYSFKGSFKVEVIDELNNIIDTYEDHNFIMEPARRTVSEMFTNSLNTGLNYLILGTCGGNEDIYIPMTEETGFSKDRTKIYSEFISVSLNTTVYLYKNEVVKIGSKYYQYHGNSGNVKITSALTNFTEVSKPYTYKLETKSHEYDGITNNSLNRNNTCLLSYTTDSGNNLENTTVTHTFIIGSNQGNSQDMTKNISVFNEAGLYYNNRLFCMKCFPAKVKDPSTQLKITWKIIF